MPEEEKEKEEPETKDEGMNESKVKEIVEKALEPIRKLISSDDSSDDNKSEDDEDESDSKKARPSRGRRSYAQVEDDAFQKVLDAAKSIIDDKEEQKKKEKEEEEKSKKIIEKAPIKIRRATSFMLGKKYMEENS